MGLNKNILLSLWHDQGLCRSHPCCHPYLPPAAILDQTKGTSRKRTWALGTSMATVAATDADASPLLALCQMLAGTSFPLFVAPIGLASLQATARLPLSIFGSGHIWWKCVSTDFPCLATDPSFFEVPQRHDLMHCYGPLRRAILAEGNWPILRDCKEVKPLAKLLRGMGKASAKHDSHGGSVAAILVGRFEIFDWDGELKLEGPPTVFTIQGALHAALGGFDAALPVRLALAPDCIVLQAGEHQATQTRRHAQHGTMIMDVVAACADRVLNYRQVQVQADGRVQLGHAGLHFVPEFESESIEEESVEVLCALFLRDGEYKIWTPDLFDTLGFDALREPVDE